MFATAHFMPLHKMDLLRHLGIDTGIFRGMAPRTNPRIRILVVSARTGVGLDAWIRGKAPTTVLPE